MRIIHHYTQERVMRSLSSEEKRVGDVVLGTCMGVQSGEKVLILTDEHERDNAAIFFEMAKKYTGHVTWVEITPLAENAQEPPADAVTIMNEADVAILITDKSLSHTHARKQACEQGTRIATMPGITRDMVMRTLAIDYDAMKPLTESITTLLTRGSRVEVASPKGTHVLCSIEGRDAIADTGIITSPGDFGNLPAGEAFLAPVEASVEGTIVFDGCFDGLMLEEPVTITIEKGRAVDFAGRQASALQKRMDAAGPKAYQVCELGIGTNPQAQLSPHILEAEKMYGTCHIAFGNNVGFGGTNAVHFHSDGLILEPTVKIDGRVVVDRGEFVE